MIGLMVVTLVAFFTCGALVLVGEFSYFKELVWNLETKLLSIAPDKCNVDRVAFQEFNVRHRML